jgi:hypothetical protein
MTEGFISGAPQTGDPALEMGLGVLSDFERSLGDPRDLTQAQISTLRDTCNHPDLGLFLFSYFVCGYDKLTWHLHYPICRLISRWGQTLLKSGETTEEWIDPNSSKVQTSFRRIMICIPRDCFKTTVGTKANSLWVLTRNPNATIGIFNENASNAESWVGSMCEIVESSLMFQVLWPELIPKGVSLRDKENGVTRNRSLKWGPTGIRFERGQIGISELSIEPHGIGGTAVGKHFSHKILDDIIGEKAVRSADSRAVMDSAIHWVDNSRPLERPAERGLELVNHTPWAYHDVYAHMCRQWKGEYLVYKRHILEDPDGRADAINGKSIFPEKMSTRQAKKILKRDPYVNSAQYMCQPKPGKETSFADEWFRYGKIVYSGQEPIFRINNSNFDPEIYDIEVSTSEPPTQFIPLSWMSKAVIFDPIPGKPSDLKKEPNSFHGAVAVGKDPWGRRYCFESQRFRCSPEEAFENVMSLLSKWKTQTLGMEDLSFVYVYQALFRQLAQRRYDWEPIIIATEPKGRQKPERILSNLQSSLETGYWYFNEKGTTEVIQEMSEHPHSQTMDCEDALAYTDEVIFRPETPGEMERSHYQRVKGEDRGICGYGF